MCPERIAAVTSRAQPLPDRVLAALEEAVGRGALIREPGHLLPYESDALTRFRQLPAAVVLPRDTEEVARVVRVLAEAGVPVTPRGAGTGLSGGGVAAEGGVVIGTSRMNRILELDPRLRLARVQAGVVNTDLSLAAAPHGLHYAPDPSSQTACTLGGNVGENAGGPHCLKYGVTTRYVTGMTVVTGRGEVLELGGANRSEGLDLTGIFVGSEGRFGLATELELRLVPRPRGVRTLLAVFSGVEAAGRAVSAIIAHGLLPAAMEIMDRGTIEAVESSIFAAGYPRDAGAVLVVEFDGTEAGLDAEAERATELCRREGATELRRARDVAERQALWQGRKKAYGAFGRIAPDLMVQDATVPRSALPRVLHQIEAIGERYGLRLANVFHAGDGNLHPKILFDRRDPEILERVEQASKEIMGVCVEAGGTITGEHGVGLDKRDYMHLVHGPRELAVMAAVQRAFDPAGVWNPGKVLPDRGGAEAPEGAGAAGEEPGLIDGARSGDGPRPGDEAREGHLRSAGIRHAPEDLVLRVDGEVTLGEVEERLAESGQWLPLDVPGQEGRTVREVVEAGSWGPLAPSHGRLRDLILGATLTVADGADLRLGGQVMKNVAGFDLVRAVPGSRGRLGRVREVVLRLNPLPRAHRVLLWEGSVEEMRSLAESLAVHPVLPASLVRLPGAPVEGATGARDPGRDRPRVMVRLLGSPATVASEAEELERAFPGCAALDRGTPGPGFCALDPVGEALEPEGGCATVLEVRGGRAAPGEVEGRLAMLGPGSSLVYHLPLWNHWRLTLDPLPEAGGEMEGLEGILAEMAATLRRAGGDLAFLRSGAGMPGIPPGTEDAVRALEIAVAGAVREGGAL